MEEEEDSTPFWLQSSTNHRRNRRRLSSIFLNSGLLIFLLCLTALVFIFFVIPSVVSFTGQIFRPNLVRKSWDSVNVVLVLFALVFGFLSRNRNHDSSFDDNHRNVYEARNEIQKSNPSTPRQWYEFADRTVYDNNSSSVVVGLKRNSSSYPDLRDVSPWVNADDRWRFSDDIQVEAHRYSEADLFRRRRSWKRVDEEEDEQEEQGETINVDTLVIRAKEDSFTPPPPSSPPPPPPPPPPSTSPPLPELPAVHRKPKRTYESIAYKELVEGSETKKTLTPPPPAVVYPSSPPSSINSEKKSSKSDRRRSGPNASKDLFSSIYTQRIKKKKQRPRNIDNFEAVLQSQPRSPPPPSPPPPSVFHNLLSSKKGKSKKILTVPPPATTVVASKTTSTALVAPIAAREPPLPLKISYFQTLEENSNREGTSHLIPIPPPPPPPPFKMPSWRFVVKGDYVKVGSMNSSRSVSPDDSPRSEYSSEAGETPTGGETAAALFWPSPDVDTEADMFIAKFRAGLKLQKMNSMTRQKHGLGLSNLGPETKPGPGPNQI